MEHLQRWYRFIQCRNKWQFNIYSRCIWNICTSLDDQQCTVYLLHGRCGDRLLGSPDDLERGAGSNTLRDLRHTRGEHPDGGNRCLEHHQRCWWFGDHAEQPDLGLHRNSGYDLYAALDDQQRDVHLE